MPNDTLWRCFHCGFETSDEREAAAHFGDRDEVEALCQTWQTLNADGRAQEYQSIQRELTAERDDNRRLRGRVEDLEYQVDGQHAAIASFRPFRECTTISQIFHVYDSMEGRALASEAKLTWLKNNPKPVQFEEGGNWHTWNGDDWIDSGITDFDECVISAFESVQAARKYVAVDGMIWPAEGYPKSLREQYEEARARKAAMNA